MVDDTLSELNQTIFECQRCLSIRTPLQKTSVINRGTASRVMIVGRNPGAKEIVSEKPFSGLSGTRLDQWLVACGNSRDNPRQGTYLTSVIKCFCGTKQSQFSKMASNCRKILETQIHLVQPKLIITLGEDAFKAVKFVDLTFRQALFQKFNSQTEVLFTTFGFDFLHLVWPHPSPLSRILNDENQKIRMQQSFAVVRQYLNEEI